MSKEVVKWEEELARQAKAVAAQERPQVSRISLRGGVMTYMDQRIPGGKMEVLILGSVMQRTYYKKAFDPNKPDAPDCFAFSETGDDMVPHEKSFEKQNATCLGCPQNEWGSATNSVSGKGKACKENRRLLIMPAGVLKKPEGIGAAEVATVDIPVTSVKNWKNYVNVLAGTVQRPPWGVVTEFMVEPDPRTQLKVTFNMKDIVDSAVLGALWERVQKAQDILQIPYEKTSEGLAPQTAAMQTGKKY